MPEKDDKKETQLTKLEKELEDTKLVKQPKATSGKDRKEIIEKVVKFTDIARKQYGTVIKSVLIFGSAARGKMRKTSDVDVWVVLDDTATKSSADLNRITSHLYLIAHELKELHIQTTTLTEFWQWVKVGSPELVNFLRYSLAVYDTGFIKPVKRMLEMGLIPPSEETIKLKAGGAYARLAKTKLDIKSMIFDLRYSATDIIQAVVMHHYKAQPDQKAIPGFLENMIKEKKLEKEYLNKFNELNKMWKDIDHGKVKKVDGTYLERALELAEDIIERMNKLLPKEYRVEKKTEKAKKQKSKKKK